MSSAAFAMSPEQLQQHGSTGSGLALFRALQQPWRWGPEGPRLGVRLRGTLGDMGHLLPTVECSQPSRDGATKLILSWGDARVETVHMPRRVSTDRVTICLSSQVGCAMGCLFCATAQLGWRRNLSAGEIVGQLLACIKQLGPRHPSDLTLVFMGMGEPLQNLAAIARAIEIINHRAGLGISPRRMTLSTAGLVPEIEQLARLDVRPLLAISLNATSDELRQRLMPIGRRYPLSLLKKTLENYPLRPRERIMIEYVLLRHVNDHAEDAERLARFVAGFDHHINLIPFNPFPGSSFEAPAPEGLDAFAQAILATRPTVVTVRRSRGQDIQGACGQLTRANALAAI
jgi:23S rRNA (adenine2503-C2)-methyltransferase